MEPKGISMCSFSSVVRSKVHFGLFRNREYQPNIRLYAVILLDLLCYTSNLIQILHGVVEEKKALRTCYVK